MRAKESQPLLVSSITQKKPSTTKKNLTPHKISSIQPENQTKHPPKKRAKKEQYLFKMFYN